MVKLVQESNINLFNVFVFFLAKDFTLATTQIKLTEMNITNNTQAWSKFIQRSQLALMKL